MSGAIQDSREHQEIEREPRAVMITNNEVVSFEIVITSVRVPDNQDAALLRKGAVAARRFSGGVPPVSRRLTAQQAAEPREVQRSRLIPRGAAEPREGRPSRHIPRQVGAPLEIDASSLIAQAARRLTQGQIDARESGWEDRSNSTNAIMARVLADHV